MTEEEIRRRWRESIGERETLLGEDRLRPLRSKYLLMHARQLDEAAPRDERLAKCATLGRCLDKIVRRRARKDGVSRAAAELGLEPASVRKAVEVRRD